MGPSCLLYMYVVNNMAVGFMATQSIRTSTGLEFNQFSPDVLNNIFLFQLCELGNFSIHIALRNLRPPGNYKVLTQFGGLLRALLLIWF